MKRLFTTLMLLILALKSFPNDLNWLSKNFASYVHTDCESYISKGEDALKSLQGPQRDSAAAVISVFKSVANCRAGLGATVEDFEKASKVLGFERRLISPENSCIAIYQVNFGSELMYFAVNPSGKSYKAVMQSAHVGNQNGGIRTSVTEMTISVYNGKITVLKPEDRISSIKAITCSSY